MRKMRKTKIVTSTIKGARSEQGVGHIPRVAVLLARIVLISSFPFSIILLTRLFATHLQFSNIGS